MRTACLFAIVLLAGCLEYEIRIETTVHPDGKIRRTLAIREKDEKKTWRRFLPPGKEYPLEGSEEEGFRSEVRLRPGRHPNGLRVRLATYESEYNGARPTDPAAEGTVVVEVRDLLIGKLYRYRETIDIGADFDLARQEAPKWLDVGLRLLVETLRRKFPDIDFAPLEKNARKNILPRLERSLVVLHQAATGLLQDARTHGYADDPAPVLENPHARFILAELARYGVKRKPFERGDWNEFLEDGAWEKGDAILDELVAPLPEAAREKVKLAILDGGDELDDAGEAAWKALYPKEEQRDRLGKELQQFAVAAFGAYQTYGIFDEFKIEVRVRLPGQVVRANGDVGAAPEVAWSVVLPVLRSPELTAHSFLPADGIKGKGWRLYSLLEIGQKLRELDAVSLDKLADYVDKARAAGWPEEPEADLGEAGGAYSKIRDAVREATGE